MMMSRSVLFFLALSVPVAAHGAGFLWPGSSDAMDRYINGANGASSSGSEEFGALSSSAASAPSTGSSFVDPWKSLSDSADASEEKSAPKKSEEEELSPIERATRAMDDSLDSGPSSMFSADHHHKAQQEDAMDKVASDAKKGESGSFSWDKFSFDKNQKSDDSQEKQQSSSSGDQQDQSGDQQSNSGSSPAPITADQMQPPPQDDAPQPTGQVFDVKLDSELQMAKAALHRSDVATGLLDGR